MFDFFSKAIPLTAAVGLVAFLWNRGILKNWFSRIACSVILLVLATLAMYYLRVGTFQGTGGLWDDLPPFPAVIFVLGFRFLTVYYLVARAWMMLGCLAVGILLGLAAEGWTR